MKVDKKATAVVQLKNFAVSSINAKILSPDSKESTKHVVDFEHFISKDDESQHLILITVNYVTNISEELKCEVGIVATAVFKFDDGIDKETMEIMIPQNCIPMTYSSMRGVVLSTTATLACGAIYLPSVNFHELYKKKAKDFQKKTKSS